MKRILILEDQRDSLRCLKRLVSEVCDRRDMIFACDNVQDAYAYAASGNINLFIVDIMLKTGPVNDVSGLTFIEHMRRHEWYMFTPVIFVTALQDPGRYAMEKLHCYGFIEKPFDHQQIRDMISEALLFPGTKTEKKYYTFKKDGIIVQIDRMEFVYAEVNKHQIIMHRNNGCVVNISYMTLRRLLEEIGDDDIFQCSRHMVVNREYIDNVDIVNRIIHLKDGLGTVEIGYTYKDAVRRAMEVIE